MRTDETMQNVQKKLLKLNLKRSNPKQIYEKWDMHYISAHMNYMSTKSWLILCSKLLYKMSYWTYSNHGFLDILDDLQDELVILCCGDLHILTLVLMGGGGGFDPVFF